MFQDGGRGRGEVGGDLLTLLVEQRGRENRSDATNKGIQETCIGSGLGDRVIYSYKIRGVFRGAHGAKSPWVSEIYGVQGVFGPKHVLRTHP